MDDASYRLSAFDKDWILDIKKNKYANVIYIALKPRSNGHKFVSTFSQNLLRHVERC